MISRIHRKLGTAGFVISIVALIAALSGGAYAASGGLSGQQKKEVRNIAKQEAKKAATQGPQGAAGAPGPQGLPGPQGATGEQGQKGDDGDDGTDGETVSVIPLAEDNGSGKCEDGGAKFLNGTGQAFACNAEGGGGSYPNTLPAGHTASGYWEVQGEKGFVIADAAALATISFPLPLAAPPTEIVMIDSESTGTDLVKCPGGPNNPQATPGILCIYVGFGLPTLQTGIPQTFGAILYFLKTDESFGSWAVTA